ncbi:family 65 glycosyl hydrolase domain-containing protein [Albibacterium bauzanense]|uniref:Maltose phosphorylase n=1 Tax=Albibacterium bauzanense TaxID=653929 RepID=A0A4R1M2W9_9SPHI|nr:family 65 glycosyl hydrolase domain-containing protein [Albibacterium bauzanense]TCK85562.1 maltose phosphorylase [Albibacterium bauzanense]
MKKYLKVDEWKIIEEGFSPELNRVSESIFSLGNGRMGHRANFEEGYSGESLQGSYLAGIYYPDKTKVGWWKNGYPEYAAKVLNAANWGTIRIQVDNELLDLNRCKVLEFKRELNMRDGYLERSFKAEFESGRQVSVQVKRFLSIVHDSVGAIRYSLTPLNFDGELSVLFDIDGDISNQDANYGEKFWKEVEKDSATDVAVLTMKTKRTNFFACTGIAFDVQKDGKTISFESAPMVREKYIGREIKIKAEEGKELVFCKYAVNYTSLNTPKDKLRLHVEKELGVVCSLGFNNLLKMQADAWHLKWRESDIEIEGDPEAQQAIRYNIFQLYQTYTGEDPALNIGPKGFTGEKYGGATHWDTEAYCIPFYLATAAPKVSRNLLIYRFKQLPQAIENAKKLGFFDGAALFPMVTMNGEECHNEWEITFEEIHRNGSISFAIYNYIRYTGDQDYLIEYGLEVLLAIARFWKQRVNWSIKKERYVILGVTGPNEYENNVDNNWYTNYIASWCLEYALEAMRYVKGRDEAKYYTLMNRIQFKEEEITSWKDIIDKMYYPKDDKQQVFLQQDGFLDKELILVKNLGPENLPLNQKWSWDRILRSCFIKQADVLQGLYFFQDRFDLDTLKRNFDFYEPMTVHESSLSPCVHSILAAKLGYEKLAYDFYLRTSRLDLDDYNNDTEDGLHITSMAGTWMTIVEGFAGMRMVDDELTFNPMLPEKWKSFSFNMVYRGKSILVKVNKEGVEIL